MSWYSMVMVWRYDRRQHKQRTTVVVFALATIMAVGGFVAWTVHSRPRQQSKAAVAPVSSKESSVRGRYLLNGTVTWTRGVEQQAGSDTSQPFSQLDSFSPAQYDTWSASLECPITDHLVTFQQAVSNLLFNCPAGFLPAAQKYFGIYDLANNHTYDQDGEAGLAQTRKNLDAVGAQYFGGYDSSDTSNICEVLSLPVRLSDGAKAALPVAFCGWQYFTRPPNETELAIMDRYARSMPVFAFVEAGVEYRAQADDRQVDVGHRLIDRGADFVIINSPHWVQNTEAYKNKLIVYSMGNFIFDQLETETNRSVSIDVAMQVAESPDLGKWLELGKRCAVYHDDCLQSAEQQNLHRLKTDYKFGIVAGQNGYKEIAHKADESTRQLIEQRTNWSRTCQQLGYNQCQ